MDAKATTGTPGAGTTSGKTDDGSANAGGPDKNAIVPGSGVEGISAKIKAGMEAGRQTADDGQDGDDADKGDDAGKGDDADDPDLSEGKIKDGEIKGLAPEAQAKVNQRIHEFNVKRKNAQAEVATANAKVAEMEAKQGDLFKEVAKLGLAPEYVTKEEAAKITRCDNLKTWNRWLGEHLGEDYEGTDPEKDPSMTAAQIKKMKVNVEEELMELTADVKGLWTTKVQLMQSDMARGRAARLAEKADDGKAKKKTDDGADKKKTVMTPPKLPGGGGATRKAPLSAGDRKPAAFDQNEFKEQGANRGALGKQFEKIFGGG